LLFAKGYELWLYELSEQRLHRVCQIPVTGLTALVARVRSLARILRAGLQTAQRLDERTVLVVARSDIWRVDLESGAVVKDFVVPGGRKLLFLTRLNGDDDSIDSIAFGEYFENPTRLPVRIWKRYPQIEPRWEIAHTFPEGCINHVHNLCRGRGGRLWILTGDFEHSAAIWLSNSEIAEPTLVLGGRQCFRGTWIRETETNDLVWATDTQLEPNHVHRARWLRGEWLVENIASIEGSCIYWQHHPDGVLFSSTVEPGAPTGHRLADLFCRSKGPGILSNDAVLYYYSEGKGLIEISRGTKDGWPSRLAQFGCFILPEGTGPQSMVVFSGQALSGLDGRVVLLALGKTGESREHTRGTSRIFNERESL
jgi:hypothetical protein